ncbi:hypothetical protein [Sphingobacterium bovistauri]|uniref:DUF4905 domain-containing protein n=1 Tax=Sphingobacterium bovistauri TaxID=2781959 RepID=A0ABS7Z815_9SPHI|nr:hypothetical protein [Sphingobacterium bovistauri]MCA5006330.1 hypothetical protein [Sphingobacterium bovistauri]
MNKYTINKAFERIFPYPIWKIEVDCAHAQIAIESRNPQTTLPIFSVLSFEGNYTLENYEVDSKEWTLEDVQGDFLILKRYGDYSPVQAGIQVIHTPSSTSIFTYMEYVIKEVYKDVIIAHHRSIPAGLVFYIDIKTGEISNQNTEIQEFPFRNIQYPIPYQGNLPSFLNEISYIDQIWLQPYHDLFLWSYHSQTSNKYNLNLSLSSKNELYDSKVVINDMDKLIPQPYFTVKEHIFFLSSNKMKISSYLV